MKAIAKHIRHRLFINKCFVRQSFAPDAALYEFANFPDRDFGGVKVQTPQMPTWLLSEGMRANVRICHT
jgi:hypothetical protein